jgi:hypothetical protein
LIVDFWRIIGSRLRVQGSEVYPPLAAPKATRVQDFNTNVLGLRPEV